MAKITHYDVGDLWTPQATFTLNASPADPTNLTVRQQTPGGVESILLNNVAVSTLTGSSSPVAKSSTGVFILNPGVSLNASGYWYVRFEGTGAITAAEEHEAIVDPSEFTSDGGLSTRALLTLAETKDWLQMNEIATGEDLDLVRVINAVSQRLHNEAEREFKVVGTNPQTRQIAIEQLAKREPIYVDGDFRGYADRAARTVAIGDLASAAQVQIIDTDWTTVLQTVASGKYALKPLNRQPWEPATLIEFAPDVIGLMLGYRVSITGNFGFPAVPEDLRQAALDSVAAFYDRDSIHWRQDLTPLPGSAEAGTTILFGASQRLLSLPPSAIATAWSYYESAVF